MTLEDKLTEMNHGCIGNEEKLIQALRKAIEQRTQLVNIIYSKCDTINFAGGPDAFLDKCDKELLEILEGK